MAAPLMHQFTFGRNFMLKEAVSLPTELFAGGSVAEREMIRLGRIGVQAQLAAGEEISRSVLAGAHIVAAQTAAQTLELEASLARMERSISREIQAGTAQVVDAIHELAAQLAIDMAAIRWQLEQQTSILRGILKVLEESRPNEARQLVQQAVQHLRVGQIEKAEERLMRALEYDTTDYQVLMNLGYVCLHKDDLDGARSRFEEARTLPRQLDDEARATAELTLARTLYLAGEYTDAAGHAAAALAKTSDRKAAAALAAGAYACLAGDSARGLAWIREAIVHDPKLMVRALTDPDLEDYREEIHELVCRMAHETATRVRASRSKLLKRLGRVTWEGEHSTSDELRQRVLTIVESTPTGSDDRTDSYSALVEGLDQLTRATPLVKTLEKLSGLLGDFTDTARRQKAAQEKRDRGTKGSPRVTSNHLERWLRIARFYVLPGLTWFVAMKTIYPGTWLAAAIFWPVLVLAGSCGQILHKDPALARGLIGAVVGMLAGLALRGVARGILERSQRKEYKREAGNKSLEGAVTDHHRTNRKLAVAIKDLMRELKAAIAEIEAETEARQSGREHVE